MDKSPQEFYYGNGTITLFPLFHYMYLLDEFSNFKNTSLRHIYILYMYIFFYVYNLKEKKKINK